MQRIYEQDKDDASLAEKTLSWVTFALRPLTVSELQHAIATMYLENEDNDVFDDDLPDEEIILAVCAGLLIVDAESKLIRLVHFTTQEYLERNRPANLASAQESILMTCIMYLSLEPFHRGPCIDDASLRHRFDRYPLLRYAALNWGDHAPGLLEEKFQSEILRYLGSKDLMASACQAAYLHERILEPIDRLDWICTLYPKDVPEVVPAAKFGLTRIFDHFRAEGYALEAGGSDGINPLMSASENRKLDMVKRLIAAGADVNKTSKKGVTCLMFAAAKGHVDIMDLLMDNGAALEPKDAWDRNALWYAVENGRALAVERLVYREGEINYDKGLLFWAIMSGQADIVDILIDRAKAAGDHVRVESTLYDLLAQGEGSSLEIDFLIDRGANINFRGHGGVTPLHVATNRRKWEVVCLLLSHQAELNSTCDKGFTPLHWATFHGHLETVSIFIQKGAHIGSKTNSGQTTLHTALAYRGNEAVVNILLENGVDMDCPDSQGQTALHKAASIGNTAIVKLLLVRGANIEARDLRGWTPLQIAAACGHNEIVELLLPRYQLLPEPSWRSLLAGAQLRGAIATGEDLITDHLLETHVDVSVPDFKGRTALYHAVFRGDWQLSKTLLNKGADSNAQIFQSAYSDRVDDEGQQYELIDQRLWLSPLHVAAGQGHAEIAQLLLNHGANVGLTTSEFSPLLIAASQEHAGIVSLILDKILYNNSVTTLDDLSDEMQQYIFGQCVSNREGVCRVILEHGACKSEAARSWGEKTLRLAVHFHDIDTMRLLEDHGFTTGYG